MVMSFNESLEHGKIGEGLIAQWLQSRGWYVIPIYEKQIDDGKGPRVYAPQGKKIIAPDALIMHPDTRRVMFVECKRKSVFSWYRKTQQWQTGVDLKHWENYLQLYSQTGYEIWLLFLHENSEKEGWDEPYPCPVGLFGQDIRKLESLGRIGREHAKGMIYWNHEDLVCLASIKEVMFSGYDELQDIWTRVLSVLEPLGTRALMQQQGRLLFLDQASACVGINSRPLFRIAKDRIGNIAIALEEVLGKRVDVSLEVREDVSLEVPEFDSLPF